MVACSKLSVWAQFSDQGLNLCPLHWKVASQPLDHQGSPQLYDSQVSPWIPGGIIPGTSYHLNSGSNLLEKKWNYLLVFYIWLNKRGLNMSQFWCPSFFQSWGQFCVCVCVCVYVQSCLLFVTLWTAAHQAPLSIGFSRQEYWSGLYWGRKWIFPTQEMNSHLLHWQADSLPLSHLGCPPGVTWPPSVALCLAQSQWQICTLSRKTLCLHPRNIPLPWGSASSPSYNPWPCVSVLIAGLWFFCHDST